MLFLQSRSGRVHVADWLGDVVNFIVLPLFVSGDHDLVILGCVGCLGLGRLNFLLKLFG